MRRAAVCLAFGGLALAALADPPVPYRPPDFRLGELAAPIAYEARLAIDPKDTSFTGEIRIDLRFQRPSPVLWLNATQLTIDSVQFRQAGQPLGVRVIATPEDFVGFESTQAPFQAGEATAVIRYRGKLDPLSTRGLFKQEEGGETYVISQFESLHARRAFPCFDEPGWKTPWRLTIDAPAANVVVSNTPETGALELADRPGWRRHAFAATKPLPSYLIALAVGPFDVVDGGTAGAMKTPLRYLAPKGRGAEMRWAREATPRLLELLEAYFGTPYPFEKLDSVTIPQAVGFGAMENVGMITYGSTLLLAADREESEPFRRRYASLAAHEIAHMWVGNLVTLAWWDDIWLNEAFATWMGNKVLYRFRPDWDTGAQRAVARGNAIAVDRLASARRVRNPVLVKEDVSGAFDSITYEKGGEVLQMFEAWLGPEAFRRGVRDFLKRHAFGSATSADFFRALGAASGRSDDALRAFNTFVDQPGVPLMDVALQCDGSSPALEVSQQRLRPVGSTAGEMQWTTPACFRYAAAGRVESQCAEIGNGKRRIELPKAGACPDWALGNAGGMGHYVVRYDAALSRRIATRAAELPDHEVVALLSDHALLANSGLVALDAALDWADAGLGHPSSVVRLAALRLLQGLRDEWLDPERLRRKRDIIAERIQPLARDLGWRQRDADRDEVRLLRVALMPFAAQREGGAALRSQARELARNRESLDATMIPPVLDTAARFADSDTYVALETAALATQERRDRRELLSALAKVRDPALRARALALAVQKSNGAERLHGRDVQLFLDDALVDEANRGTAFAFIRDHFDALVAKMPQHTPGRFATRLNGLCTRADRDAFAAFFKERSGKFLGGERRYLEALETIELCVAAHGGA